MTAPTNTEKTSKKGRPFKDPVSKYRTLLWYWAIRQKSGLSDGKLDIEFSDPEPDGRKRNYEDRVRVFEDIRKSGATISGGKHKRRNFDLIERINNFPELQGSADLYQSIFWEIIGDTKPTLEKTINDFLTLIKICKLSTIKLYTYPPLEEYQMEVLSELHSETPNEYQLNALSELYALIPNEFQAKLNSALYTKSPREITETLEPDLFTNESKVYDDILQSFSNVTKFNEIAKGVDFRKLSDYLNILSLYVSFYRYALLTANFHAMLSSANSINEHLSLFLITDIKWLEKDFTKKLFHLIYHRVFHSESNVELGRLDINTLDENLENDSALYKLFELLNN